MIFFHAAYLYLTTSLTDWFSSYKKRRAIERHKTNDTVLSSFEIAYIVKSVSLTNILRITRIFLALINRKRTEST